MGFSARRAAADSTLRYGKAIQQRRGPISWRYNVLATSRLFPGQLADLTEQDAEGTFRRTIIKTENPDRYGINVGDYFV